MFVQKSNYSVAELNSNVRVGYPVKGCFSMKPRMSQVWVGSSTLWGHLAYDSAKVDFVFLVITAEP